MSQHSRFSLFVSTVFLLLLAQGQHTVSAFQPTTTGGAHPLRSAAMTSSSTDLSSTVAGDWDLSPEEKSQQKLVQQQRRQLKLTTTPSAAAAALPSALELPRHSTVHVPNATGMAYAERMLGRVAMVSAFVLLTNEVMTGQSLQEQIMSVLSLVGGN